MDNGQGVRVADILARVYNWSRSADANAAAANGAANAANNAASAAHNLAAEARNLAAEARAAATEARDTARTTAEAVKALQLGGIDPALIAGTIADRIDYNRLADSVAAVLAKRLES
jgi:hypothetical protein